MFPSVMTLPPYHMTAGESKNITIPIYRSNGKPIDATGMTARFAISDYVNIGSAPLVSKNCRVLNLGANATAVLFVELDPVDTVNLHGKFIYQITGKDIHGEYGVMRGELTISPNQDKASTSM